MKMYLVGWMMNNKKVRSKLGNKINEGMVAPYRDLLYLKYYKTNNKTHLFVLITFLLLGVFAEFKPKIDKLYIKKQ